jgi:hypothetical protein
MSTTVQAFATLGTNEVADGVTAWISPANAGTSTPTTCTLAAGFLSQYLVATGFGFSIPYGALIRGIQFDMDCQSSVLSTVREKNLQAVKAQTRYGTVKNFGLIQWGTGVVNFSIGSAVELYNQPWFSWDINATGFGVAIQCEDPGALLGIASIKNVRATITYDNPVISTVASYLSMGNH